MGAQGRRSPPIATDGRHAGGLVRVVAAAATMGTLGPIAAVAYAQGLGPATLSTLRAAIGAAILGALVVASLQPSIDLRRLARRQRATLALVVVSNALTNLLLFLAFGAMAVGLVMVLYYAYPAIVAFLAAALGRERLTQVRILALASAGVGIALVLGGQLDPGAHATTTGLLLAGAAATCHAIYVVAIPNGFDDVPAVQATSLVLAGGVAISGAAALLLDGPAVVGEWLASPVAWAAILCAGTVGALPKVWVIGGIRLIGSTRAAVAMLVEPIVAVAVAAVALGQGLTAIELAGAAAILVAVVLAQVPARKPSMPGPPSGPAAAEPARLEVG